MNQYLNTISDLVTKGIIRNRIQKIEINRFRNFEENSSINFSHPLTVLVGKNGTGKSTILKIIQGYKAPKEYFIETVLESPEINNTHYSIFIDGEGITYTRKNLNSWNIIGEINSLVPIKHIDTKKMVGSFDKNFLYDNIGKHTKRQAQVDYLIKQSRKINQNRLEKSQKKNLIQYNAEQINVINRILQRNYKEISILNHRYFNGTWGTTLLFKNEHDYTDYNSGGGEFSLSMLIWQVSNAPNNSVVLIDEPEIGLHPGAQKRLMTWIMQMIIKKKLQVIVSTHSSSIIEDLPNDCIKCISNFNNGSINIRENIMFTEAFHELEIINSRHASIIVEDSLAKDILEAILNEEGHSHTFSVQYTSGGADYIKAQIIPILSKMHFSTTFVLLDGDQSPRAKIDLSDIPEKYQTLDFLKGKFKEATSIKSSSINWGIDGNSKQKTSNQEQSKEYLMAYLNYYASMVEFFPYRIPEEIIWDYKYAKSLYPDLNESLLENCKDTKEEFWILSKLMKVEINVLYKIFISNFIKRNKGTSTYQDILNILKKWTVKI